MRHGLPAGQDRVRCLRSLHQCHCATRCSRDPTSSPVRPTRRCSFSSVTHLGIRSGVGLPVSIISSGSSSHSPLQHGQAIMKASVSKQAPPWPQNPGRRLNRQHDAAPRDGLPLRSSGTAFRRPWASTTEPSRTNIHSVPGDNLMAAFLAYQAASCSAEEPTERETDDARSAVGGLAGSLAEQQIQSTAATAGLDGRLPGGRCWLVGSGPGALEHVTVTATFFSSPGACLAICVQFGEVINDFWRASSTRHAGGCHHCTFLSSVCAVRLSKVSCASSVRKMLQEARRMQRQPVCCAAC